jgi:hypothetical protein
VLKNKGAASRECLSFILADLAESLPVCGSAKAAVRDARPFSRNLEVDVATMSPL